MKSVFFRDHTGFSLKIFFLIFIFLIVLIFSACGKKQEPVNHTVVHLKSNTLFADLFNKIQDECSIRAVKYKNDKSIEYKLTNGTHVLIGINKPNLNAHALYLNLEAYFDDADIDRYGFYVTATKGTLYYSEDKYTDCNSELYPGVQYYIIRDRTYDTLTPSTFRGEDYFGIKWDAYNKTHAHIDSDDIYIRVVNLDTGMPCGVLKAVIRYDEKDNSYSIESLQSNDVKTTKVIPIPARDTLLQAAQHFFETGTDEFKLSFSSNLFKEMIARSTVENIPQPYFSKLYNMKSNAIRSSSLNGYNIFAVNIPYPDFSVLTAYFVQEEGQYKMVGYDAFSPFSQSTLADNLYPDDIEFFLTSAQVS